MMTASWAVLGGFVLDAIFGDPAWLPHPVVYMGKAISRLEKFLRSRLPQTPQGELLGGAVVAFCLPVGTLLFTGLVCWGAAMLHPLLGLAVQMFWCGQALAAKGLVQESTKVYAFFQLGIDIHALLHQPLCGQCLPTPEHLDGQPQQGVKHRRAPADKAREQQRPHRQAERQHRAAQQFALRRLGQAGAEEFFQPGDGFAHVHHRVGQPCRVAENGIQHEASQHSPVCHHTPASASFVYCTVFTRRSWRFNVS